MKNLISLFKNKKVLIVGDVMVDRYLLGSVNRMSPEAPVPVVDFGSEENRLGGAANVALNVAALGGKPFLLSVVGKDRDGKLFQQLLRNNQLTRKGIVSVASRPTTVKTRVMAASQHLLRIDRETKKEITRSVEDRLLKKVRKILTEHTISVVLFQDYNKGVLTKRIIREISKMAADANIPTVVDPKFDHFFEYKKVKLFKPNLKEVRQIVPFPVAINLKSLTEAAAFLEKKLKHSITMITLSEHGIFIKEDHLTEIIPTAPRIIADVCGAGDAVISVAALGIAAGLPISQIARISNDAGGKVCEKVGVVPITIQDLMAGIS